MKKNTYIHYFIKFGKKEFMENLLNKGEIYMQTVQYYRDHKNIEIGDVNEGLMQIKLPNITSINGIKVTTENVRVNYNNAENKNLYCVYSVKDIDVLNGINKNNEYIINIDSYKGFGDYCVVIYNLPEFVYRLDKAAKKKGLQIKSHKPVNYINILNYKDNISEFDKDIKYEHQKEYRFLIENNDNESISLELGKLNDIAILKPIEGNELVLEFEINNGKTK